LAPLPPGKTPRYPLYRRLGRPQRRAGHSKLLECIRTKIVTEGTNFGEYISTPTTILLLSVGEPCTNLTSKSKKKGKVVPVLN
jgi:hypothetical protein